jgi:flagellar biosynthetic protein FlhB
MAETDDQEDKTEDPTGRRLEKAAEKGDIPRSMEISTWFVLGGGTLALMISGGSSSQTLALAMRGMLGNAHTIPTDGAGLMTFGSAAILTTLGAIAIPMILLMLAGILGNVLQNPPRITTEQIGFKLERISPIAGFKRIFGKEAWVQLLKGLFKMGLVGAAIYTALWPERDRLESLVLLDVRGLLPFTQAESLKLLGTVLVIYAFVAAGDYLYQRMTWFKRQMMTRRDLKDEFKETEGNPEIKAKLRQLRAQASRRRMMSRVPKATVVVMNPTHFAVALQYEKGMTAPLCVAKGQDAVALRIRAVAEENDVPVVENAPLAGDGRVSTPTRPISASPAPLGEEDVRAVERAFTGAPDVSEAIYRLSQAAREVSPPPGGGAPRRGGRWPAGCA